MSVSVCRRLFAVVLVLANSASFAAPQQTLTESIEVRIANIDVVVRDKAGNPVTGLTKDDFEIFEDGKKQPITNLYEVRRNVDIVTAQPAHPDETPTTPAAPVEQRPRKLILFIDSFSLQASRKAPILAAVEKFIDRQMKPEDQAMLVSWRLSVNVITPFTSDKAAVKNGIATLALAPRGPDEVSKLKADVQELIRIAHSNTLMMGMAEAHRQSLQLVDAYGANLNLREEGLLNDLGRMASTLAGVEGKKVLVFAGENLPEHPGAELYRYVEAQFAPFLSRNDNPLDLQVLSGVTGNRMQQTITKVANQAGAYGVTIYTIDAADTNSDFSAETGASGPPDPSESFSRYENTAAALQTMASITGGVAIANTTNFDLAFDTIGRDLDSYYSLGYKPRENGGSTRRIVVKTKNRAYKVRTPETFILRSSEDQMKDRTIANLYADVPSAWPVAIRTKPPKKDGRGIYAIPVQVVMASTLTLLPEGKDLVGGFVLYFTVGSVAGGPSEVMRRPETLRIPATAEAAVRAKPMTFTTTIRVKQGESMLSVGVIDQTSTTTGFARLKLVAQ
jgi:VWFA-related protein